MGAIWSPITSLTIVYSIVYSDADQGKHQSSASLAFVRGIHRSPVNSPHKWPVTRKMFPLDDVIMDCFKIVSGLWNTKCKSLFNKKKLLLKTHVLTLKQYCDCWWPVAARHWEIFRHSEFLCIFVRRDWHFNGQLSTCSGDQTKCTCFARETFVPHTYENFADYSNILFLIPPRSIGLMLKIKGDLYYIRCGNSVLYFPYTYRGQDRALLHETRVTCAWVMISL